MLTFVILFVGILIPFLISYLYAGLTPDTYKIKCPRCTGEALVTVTGSADQFESTSCSCGYKKEEIL